MNNPALKRQVKAIKEKKEGTKEERKEKKRKEKEVRIVIEMRSTRIRIWILTDSYSVLVDRIANSQREMQKSHDIDTPSTRMLIDMMSVRIVGTQGMTNTSSPDPVIDVHVRRTTRLLVIAVVGIVQTTADMTMILNVAKGVAIPIVVRILERTGTLLRDLIHHREMDRRSTGVKSKITVDGMATQKRDKWTGGMNIELHLDQRLSISIQDRYLLVTAALVMGPITHIPMVIMARVLLGRARRKSELKG